MIKKMEFEHNEKNTQPCRTTWLILCLKRPGCTSTDFQSSATFQVCTQTTVTSDSQDISAVSNSFKTLLKCLRIGMHLYISSIF